MHSPSPLLWDHDMMIQNDAYACKVLLLCREERRRNAVNPLISFQLTLPIGLDQRDAVKKKHGMACLLDHSGDDDQCPGSHFDSVWTREWAWLIGDYKKHTQNPIKLSKVKQAPGLPLINKYKLFMVGLLFFCSVFCSLFVITSSWREKEACTSQLLFGMHCAVCTARSFSCVGCIVFIWGMGWKMMNVYCSFNTDHKLSFFEQKKKKQEKEEDYWSWVF